jgi:hypothetical protein
MALLLYWVLDRSIQMAKSKTQNEILALPDPTIWARAVLLGTAVLGVTMNDRSLNAKNVEVFGQKVREAAQPFGPAAWALVLALETRVRAIGVNVECDRLRTARSANALCEAVVKVPAVAIVEALAQARFETSSSAVQTSLATASQSLATLEDPAVTRTLQRLGQWERSDLSAAKYLREARAILQQDETRRSLQFDLRMVVGAADAYLAAGKHDILGAVDEKQDDAVNAPGPPRGIANVVTSMEVMIGSKSAPPPPMPPRQKKEFVKKTTDLKTLASEVMPVLTQVNVERRATGLDRAAARELLDDAYEEAKQKIENTAAPMVVTVLLSYDMMREG